MLIDIGHKFRIKFLIDYVITMSRNYTLETFSLYVNILPNSLFKVLRGFFPSLFI